MQVWGCFVSQKWCPRGLARPLIWSQGGPGPNVKRGRWIIMAQLSYLLRGTPSLRLTTSTIYKVDRTPRVGLTCIGESKEVGFIRPLVITNECTPWKFLTSWSPRRKLSLRNLKTHPSEISKRWTALCKQHCGKQLERTLLPDIKSIKGNTGETIYADDRVNGWKYGDRGHVVPAYPKGS